MKNLIGLIVLVLVVAGCSFLKKNEETKPPAPTASNTTTKTEDTATKPETTTKTTDDKTTTTGLTLEKFNQIQNGMKYEEVVKILGGEGTETSSFSSGSTSTVTYKWEGEKYARITATFRNGELASKIQTNVKSGSENTSSADLSLAKYNQIQNEMSYEEAVKIIGSEGTQTSSSNFGKIKVASYKWEGEKYAKIFASFRDNKLTSKSQSNLK